MINVRLAIDNPWAKENFKNLFNRSGLISENKAWEFEIIRHNYTIVDVGFTYTVRQDHAGPSLTCGLFGYSMEFKVYDTRHWSDLNNDWEVYKE